jgi:hypothetical protein
MPTLSEIKKVAGAINRLLGDRTPEHLDKIVIAMREDLGMETLDDSTSTKGLLPAPKQKETL